MYQKCISAQKFEKKFWYARKRDMRLYECIQLYQLNEIELYT
jgi:hypothetical protein